MGERAIRAGLGPVSLDPQNAGLASCGCLAAIGASGTLPLPDSPALICADGAVIQANPAVAQLAGRRRPEALLGLPLTCLLTGDGTDAELIGPEGWTTPVRVARWKIPGTDLLAVFLVDVSDLRSARDALHEERRRIAEALIHQATHDELTGLPNRTAIKDTLAELLAAPARDLAVLFCDIDNFTRVNDSLGHDAGDELLVALAQRLTAGLPERCSVARLSGDVFVVICSDVSGLGGIGALVTIVSELLRTVVPVHGQSIRVSAAIGVALPDPSTTGPEDLLRFADAALFQAKRQSRGQFALANAALRASADRQVELEGQLREALLNDGLRLHYQPVVGPDGAVLTGEALVRWPHPELGMLTPKVFLPVAEQGGLLRELDLWVLRTALREARDWVRSDGSPVAVAVNLSGLVPGDPGFVAAVHAAVGESGMPWDRVVLELVETALADLPWQTRHEMAELVECGVRFAVDDFGTGYSSLARLKELPTQIVKVDRRFVSGMGVDPSDYAVARAVVELARAMGRCCVAEGVETHTQFEALRRLDVDAYQGWLFSRAVGAAEFRALLTSACPRPVHDVSGVGARASATI